MHAPILLILFFSSVALLLFEAYFAMEPIPVPSHRTANLSVLERDLHVARATASSLWLLFLGMVGAMLLPDEFVGTAMVMMVAAVVVTHEFQ